MAAPTLVDVNAGSDDELQCLLLRVPHLATPTLEQIVKAQAQAVRELRRHALARECCISEHHPPTSFIQDGEKHLQVVGSVERARDTSYGRELVGLCVRIPWSSWDGYADGSGFDTGTVVH